MRWMDHGRFHPRSPRRRCCHRVVSVLVGLVSLVAFQGFPVVAVVAVDDKRKKRKKHPPTDSASIPAAAAGGAADQDSDKVSEVQPIDSSEDA